MESEKEPSAKSFKFNYKTKPNKIKTKQNKNH